MSSLVDIQLQIEKLQKQASEIKNREFDQTVLDIRAKMQAFGISVKDLQGPAGRKGRGKAKTTTLAKPKATKNNKVGVAVAAKFSGPNGETWSGRGLTPRWLSALLAQGRAKEEFAIKG